MGTIAALRPPAWEVLEQALTQKHPVVLRYHGQDGGRMTTARTYKASVTRDGRWWMIHVPDIDGLTQARRLGEAAAMARSLIAITLAVPADSFDIDIEVESVGAVHVAERTAHLRAEREAAVRLDQQVQADAESLARDLAGEGLPVRDIGDILGVSYQRAHQLITR